MDKELKQFNDDLLESIRQMKRGEKAKIHPPGQIQARRGRPAGSAAAVTKTPVKIRLDPDLLAALRATGKGWQTRVNDMLRRDVLDSK
jgi:uncharacterized protein (DUF4415 family)